jgi:hypothetical protein
MIDKENYIQVLKNEIEVLKSRIREYDTGHLFTTIDVLKNRIEEIQNEVELSLV